jgi:L-rhamnose-H+ transport protein
MGRFAFSSWAIHMILLVMISTLAGLLLKEWKGTRSVTRMLLMAALTLLAVAVLILTYGNRLATEGMGT